jgi:hypothetical protein
VSNNDLTKKTTEAYGGKYGAVYLYGPADLGSNERSSNARANCTRQARHTHSVSERSARTFLPYTQQTTTTALLYCKHAKHCTPTAHSKTLQLPPVPYIPGTCTQSSAHHTTHCSHRGPVVKEVPWVVEQVNPPLLYGII